MYYSKEKFKEQLGNREIAHWDISEHATYYIRKDGTAFSVSHIENNIKKLKHSNSGRGYIAYSINGKTVTAHKMVAKTFIPNKDNKKQVNHIDGNKNNNNVTNLEWVDQNENMQHAWDNGLRGQRKLTNIQVREIRKKYDTGKYTQRQLGKEYNVTHTIIGSIVRGTGYKFVH